MTNYIKNLLKTSGWKEMEKIWEDKIQFLGNMNIDENVSAEEYKTIDLANKKAAYIIKQTLNQIKLRGGEIEKTTKSYK